MTKTEVPATIIVRPNSTVEDLVRAQVAPTIQTGYLNASLIFTAKLTNKGAVAAIGCHFRSTLFSDLQTRFYEINPANGARISTDNKPVNLAAGQTRSFKVTVVSQSVRDADHIDPEVVGDCANNHRRVQPLRGDIDVTTSGYSTHLPALALTSRTPSSDVLNVPASGFAYYKFQVKNTQLPEPLDVLPAYVGPFDDPTNTNYSVAIFQFSLSTGAHRGIARQRFLQSHEGHGLRILSAREGTLGVADL